MSTRYRRPSFFSSRSNRISLAAPPSLEQRRENLFRDFYGTRGTPPSEDFIRAFRERRNAEPGNGWWNAPANSPRIQAELDAAINPTADREIAQARQEGRQAADEAKAAAQSGATVAAGVRPSVATRYGTIGVNFVPEEKQRTPLQPIVDANGTQTGVSRLTQRDMHSDLWKRHERIFVPGTPENEAYVRHAKKFGEADAYRNVDNLMRPLPDSRQSLQIENATRRFLPPLSDDAPKAPPLGQSIDRMTLPNGITLPDGGPAKPVIALGNDVTLGRPGKVTIPGKASDVLLATGPGASATTPINIGRGLSIQGRNGTGVDVPAPVSPVSAPTPTPFAGYGLARKNPSAQDEEPLRTAPSPFGFAGSMPGQFGTF